MIAMVRASGAFFILVGLVALVAPDFLFSSLSWEMESGRYLAAVLRIGFGVLMFGAASLTRYPAGMRALGVFLVLSGLAYALLPGDSWTNLIEWLDGDGQGLYRFGAAAGGVLAGLFVVQACQPEGSTSRWTWA